jgi:tetratricopeptide (TPR) repeat protein
MGLAAWLTVTAATAAPLTKHTVDTEELQRVREATPRAAEAFEQAEEKLRRGDLQGAERLLGQARDEDGRSFLLARRHCQVLTELGRGGAALEACRVALTRSTAMDARAFVGAMMAQPRLLKPGEIAQAVREAVSARRLPQQPFSEGALCDIAYHIGDEAMLDSCVKNLQRLAPQHAETLRWQAVRKQSPGWALWLGWLALGALVAVTALHALWRWLRGPAKPARAAVAASAMVAAALCGSRSAQAQDQAPSAAAVEGSAQQGRDQQRWQLSTRFPIHHDDPESAIPSIEDRNKNPLEFGYFLQDLAAEAIKAEQRGDWRAAARYWKANAKAVPDVAIGYGRACRAHQVLGEREQALELCATALNRMHPRGEDYLRYGELMTDKPLALTPLEIQDLDAVIAHLKKEPGQEGPAAVIECRLGVKLDDVVRLDRCTKVLGKLSPSDPHTLTFQWSYAMLRHDYGEAKRFVKLMEKSSMAPPALARVKDATAKASAWWRLPFTDWRYAVAVLGALLALALGLVLLRRRLSRLSPEPGAGAAPAT